MRALGSSRTRAAAAPATAPAPALRPLFLRCRRAAAVVPVRASAAAATTSRHQQRALTPSRTTFAAPTPRTTTSTQPNHRSLPPPAAFTPETALALAAFFAPGVALAITALVKGRGNARDGASRLLTELSQGYFQPDVGGESIPVAEGELSDLAGDEPLFKALFGWFLQSGGVYKLVFGPKAFVVISDPVVVRHILRDNAMNYDKGVLAEILEPIMGKGLIPADLETWKIRRRAIVPAFHKAYYESMAQMFARCTQRTVDKLEQAIDDAEKKGGAGAGAGGAAVVDMEAEFLSLGLDIIGLGVFNYDFGSITSESPVIKAVYGVLKGEKSLALCV
jgi:hypothetical protein